MGLSHPEPYYTAVPHEWNVEKNATGRKIEKGLKCISNVENSIIYALK